MHQETLSFYEQNKEQTLELIRRSARHCCYKNGSVTADDIRDDMGEAFPKFLDRRIIGAALGHSKMFRCVGYTKTKVKASHGRPIGIFKLVREHPTTKGLEKIHGLEEAKTIISV